MSERLPPQQPGKRSRPWNVRDTRRLTAAERGYDSRWAAESKHYRKLHPLCVPCLLLHRTRASQCVDHIIPRHSCPDLFWEVSNWAAMCNSCHAFKTRIEPREEWIPNHDRVVVCGLPGCGKTTLARSMGVPRWDADDYPMLTTKELIIEARDQWMNEHQGACVVIVASIMTASLLAARMRGVVRHMTEQYIDRNRAKTA